MPKEQQKTLKSWLAKKYFCCFYKLCIIDFEGSNSASPKIFSAYSFLYRKGSSSDSQWDMGCLWYWLGNKYSPENFSDQDDQLGPTINDKHMEAIMEKGHYITVYEIAERLSVSFWIP